MFDLIELIFNICVFKKAPQDLPYSSNLLKILLISNIFIGFLQSSMGVNWLNALLKAAINTLLIAGFSWICLFFTRKLARFYQTTSALLGTDALIGLFALPVIATSLLNQAGLLVFLAMMALIIWNWIVTGHIMRNALEQSLSFSLGLALLYLLISYQVTALIIF